MCVSKETGIHTHGANTKGEEKPDSNRVIAVNIFNSQNA